MSSPHLVKRINRLNEASAISELIALGNTLFFSAEGDNYGRELWRSDGSEDGTFRVADINPEGSSSEPKDLTTVGEILFFSAHNDNYGRELWKSDGTESGTVRVADISPGTSGSNPEYLTSFGEALFFNANDGTRGYELWKSDGTEKGTILLADIKPDGDYYGNPYSSNPYKLTVANDRLFFIADTKFDSKDIWKSDGTPEGTGFVAEIYPDKYSIHNLHDDFNFTEFNETVYFNGQDYRGVELWKINDTEKGITLVNEIEPKSYIGSMVGDIYYGSYPDHLTRAGDTLFFSADNGNYGRELWKSDGTEKGTVLLADINPEKSSQCYYYPYPYCKDIVKESDPKELTAVGNTLFFSADDGNNGRELWKSDGTEKGTLRVTDINLGESSSDPKELIAVNNVLFFTANDGTNGRHLWKSDGTEAGTVRVSEINSDKINSDIGGLTLVNDTLFFHATDGNDVDELWKVDVGLESSTPSLALTNTSVKKKEGNGGVNRFKFNVTRTGDLSDTSKASWTVSGIGKNTANANDFMNDILPSGIIRFRPGQDTRTITIRVKSDQIQELDEKFRLTISNATRASIDATAASAIGVIRDEDQIGSENIDTIKGTQRAEFINGLGGQDMLTGGGGIDHFAFWYGQSQINKPDQITDFRFDEDKITLVNRKGKFSPIPQNLSRAANNNTAATLKDLANAVFVDADALRAGDQALAAKSAALVKSTNSKIAGTYLLINDGNAGLSLKRDLLINISGASGCLPDFFGTVPVESIFI